MTILAKLQGRQRRPEPTLLRATGLLALALGFWTALTVGAPAVEPVPTFEKLIHESVERTLADRQARFDRKTKKWHTYRFAVSDLKFDVTKTDSLVNPIVGVVAFTLVVGISESAANSKEEAEKLDKFKVRVEYVPTLTYTFKNGTWKFKDGSFWVPLMKTKFPVTVKDVTQGEELEPNNALRHWILPFSGR